MLRFVRRAPHGDAARRQDGERGRQAEQRTGRGLAIGLRHTALMGVVGRWSGMGIEIRNQLVKDVADALGIVVAGARGQTRDRIADSRRRPPLLP